MSEGNRVFVAGGTGTAGGAYARAFAARGYEVKATARDERGAETLAARGVDVVDVDLADAEATADAIDGAGAVLVALLGRGEGAPVQEESITRNVFDAASGAGVRRVIYTSVHTADRATGVPHFEVKGRLERYLADAPVPATVLRPCTFMDALSAPWILEGLLDRAVLASPIAIDAPISYIATADLAEVAVAALEEPDLAGQTIELGGPRAVTYRELIPTLSELVGRTVEYQQLPLDMVEAQLGSDMAAMIRLFNKQGFAVDVDRVVARLGVELTSVEAFLRRAVVAPDAPTGPLTAGTTEIRG